MAALQEIADDRDIVKRRRMPLAEIPQADKVLGEALAYWQSLRQDGLLPSRDDVDVLDLRPLVGNIHLVDVGDDPSDIRFGLYGTRVPLQNYKDFTGKGPGMVGSAAYSQAVMEDYKAVQATGTPCYQHIVARIDYIVHSYARLILPLADDGRHVNKLLVCINVRPFEDLTP